MLLAMEEIVYEFIGENSSHKAKEFLLGLIVQEGNQYSYKHCWVVESEEGVIAMANIYNGAKLKELRQGVVESIKRMFGRDYCPEDETQAGEYYIDCLAVSPQLQGEGIGTKMLEFLIQEYVGKRKKNLGLLVDKNNPAAKKLYLKLGFEPDGERTLTGKKFDHLQLKATI